MTLPRLHLFELEDQPWFPPVVRDLATDYLRYIEDRFALHQPVVGLLREGLEASGADTVVDLCSGGGGPVLSLRQALAEEGITPRFVLTDRFPNLPAFQHLADEDPKTITFAVEPVDARAVPERLRGFRTLFNAFHHFHPEDAAGVLRDAVRAGQPIGIFEIPERGAHTLVPMVFLTPLIVALATPFIRPFAWKRLLWTYLVPLVPLTCWWDGIVSQLRAYTPEELEELACAAGGDSYTWKVGKVPIGASPGSLTYLIGYPARP